MKLNSSALALASECPLATDAFSTLANMRTLRPLFNAKNLNTVHFRSAESSITEAVMLCPKAQHQLGRKNRASPTAKILFEWIW
jgi:hypothetical protein